MLLRYATIASWFPRQLPSQLISKPVKQAVEKSRSTLHRYKIEKNEEMWNMFSHILSTDIKKYNTFYHTFRKNPEGKCLYIQRRWTRPDHSGASAMLQPQRLKDHVLMYTSRSIVQMGSVTSYAWLYGTPKNRILPQLQFIRPFIWVTTPFRTSRG